MTLGQGFFGQHTIPGVGVVPNDLVDAILCGLVVAHSWMDVGADAQCGEDGNELVERL